MSAATFADLFRDARLARGLQQKEIAARFGVVPAYISRLEKGFSHPSNDLLVTMCNEFGWDLADMWLLVQAEKTSTTEIVADITRLRAAWRRELEGE